MRARSGGVAVTTAEVPGTEPPRSDRAQFWARTRTGWDIAFYLMMAIGAAAVLLDPVSPTALATVLSLMVVLVVAYTVVGRRAAWTGDRRLAWVYQVVLVVLVVAIVRMNPLGSILLFIAYSQVWYFTERRRTGAAMCAVLSIGVAWAVIAFNEYDPERVPDALAQGALALVFSVLLGLWVTRVAEESEERADLLERLEGAQAELGASHHAAGVTAERERMAREIHDTLAQGFTSIVMLAQTAAADLERGDPDQAAQRVRLVERTARDNLAEARALVAAFAPVALDGSTLAEALERLARRFHEETGVQVEVVGPAAMPGLSRDREVILLRAAQEALANVRRHAHARHVQLVLGTESAAADREASVHLEVVDDGRGIDPAVTEGFGLRGMRERVTSGGGRLAVNPRAEGGTRVRVTLPTDDLSTDDLCTDDRPTSDDPTERTGQVTR